MDEETLGMIIGFIIAAPIGAYFTYRFVKKRKRGGSDPR